MKVRGPVKSTLFPSQLDIDVTKNDITLGYPGDAGRCPVALAAKRLFAFNPTARIFVSSSIQVNMISRTRWLRRRKILDIVYGMPVAAQDFVVDFDRTGTGTPISFSTTRIIFRG